MVSAIPRGVVIDDPVVRFINDDRNIRGERVYFANGEHNQSVACIPIDQMRGRPLFTPTKARCEEVIQGLEEIMGVKLPEGFFRDLNILLVPGVMYYGGITVASRVMRQQIFIGAMPVPYTDELLHMTLFHTLGNALWNYLDYRFWGGRSSSGDDDEEGSEYAEKNEYRTLRNFPYTGGNSRNRVQRTLFYVASEDFRYLFGTPEARKGEWFLSEETIGPPNPEVINFWKREIARGSNNTRA